MGRNGAIWLALCSMKKQAQTLNTVVGLLAPGRTQNSHHSTEYLLYPDTEVDD